MLKHGKLWPGTLNLYMQYTKMGLMSFHPKIALLLTSPFSKGEVKS